MQAELICQADNERAEISVKHREKESVVYTVPKEAGKKETRTTQKETKEKEVRGNAHIPRN